MREIVRTNDAVLVSAIEALLNGADIPHVVARPQYERAGGLDRHLAAPHPGGRGRRRGGAPAAASTPASATNCAPMEQRRVLRPLGDSAPRTRCSAAGCGCASPARSPGRARRDPAGRGLRRRSAGEQVVDLGAGVGAAGLALAARVAGCRSRWSKSIPCWRRWPPRMPRRNGLAARVRTVASRRGARPRAPSRRPGLKPETFAARADEPAVQRSGAATNLARHAAPARPCGPAHEHSQPGSRPRRGCCARAAR